jgi:hypothetical protein
VKLSRCCACVLGRGDDDQKTETASSCVDGRVKGHDSVDVTHLTHV